MDALDRGFAAGAAELTRAGALPQQARVARVAVCRLGDFPDGAVFPDDDLRASVVWSVGGTHSATALISLEPEEALAWIRWLAGEEEAQGPEALQRFRLGAETLARHAMSSLGGGALEVKEGALHEAPLVQTLLGTHAPPDTAVLSTELAVASESGSLSLCFYLLMDAKVLGALAASLV